MSALWVVVAVLVTYLVTAWDERHGLTRYGRWRRFIHHFGIHERSETEPWKCRICERLVWMKEPFPDQYLVYGDADDIAEHITKRGFSDDTRVTAKEIATGCWSVRRVGV